MKSLRGVQAARIIRLAVIMSQREFTVTELAQKIFNCRHENKKCEGDCACRKMVRRDIQTLELAGIPVQQNGVYYRIDAHFMRRFT